MTITFRDLARFAILGVMLSNVGCIFDRAMNRSLVIVQGASISEEHPDAFVVEQKVPKTWIESESFDGGHLPTLVRVAMNRRVKIILVPETIDTTSQPK